MGAVSWGAWIYIDGFNLYSGALKGTPYKWLNLKQLSDRLLPPNRDAQKVKYFTARVFGAADADAPRRQQMYLNALSTVPEIQVFFGSFLLTTIHRPVINLLIAAQELEFGSTRQRLSEGTYTVIEPRPRRLVVGRYLARANQRRRGKPKPLPDALVAEVHTMEEKGSDVNLATHLLNDAWRQEFTEAVVVSNDTDLLSPIQMMVNERNLPITLVNPHVGADIASAFRDVATHPRHLTKNLLSAPQFPDPIVRPNGTVIEKPDDC